jgi:hypothetical protein
MASTMSSSPHMTHVWQNECAMFGHVRRSGRHGMWYFAVPGPRMKLERSPSGRTSDTIFCRAVSSRFRLNPLIAGALTETTGIEVYAATTFAMAPVAPCPTSQTDLRFVSSRSMYRVFHIRCNTARHERDWTAYPRREQDRETLRRLAEVKIR